MVANELKNPGGHKNPHARWHQNTGDAHSVHQGQHYRGQQQHAQREWPGQAGVIDQAACDQDQYQRGVQRKQQAIEAEHDGRYGHKMDHFIDRVRVA